MGQKSVLQSMAPDIDQIVTFLCLTFPIELHGAQARSDLEGHRWEDLMRGSLTIRALAAFLSRHPAWALIVQDRCLQILSQSEEEAVVKDFFHLLGYHFLEYQSSIGFLISSPCFTISTFSLEDSNLE